MPAPERRETAPTLFDWLLFAAIVAVGGSSFAMIRGAVESVPPAVITVGRLWIGAIFLYAVMRHAGRKLPSLSDPQSQRPINQEWLWILAISVIGYVGPFLIFPWAQQFIDSGLAGIYMAFMPIWTVFLAFLFAGESLNRQKIVGFALGFAGVVILIGPAVLGEAATSSLAAQLALLLATLGYAAAAVITRMAPPIRPRAFAAATLIPAAILSTPVLFFTDWRVEDWTLAGVVNVIGLGLGPTGLGGVLLIILIQRVGAGFMAFANYLTPLWAVGMGALLFGERLGANALIALVVILVGVAVSQRTPRKSNNLSGHAGQSADERT